MGENVSISVFSSTPGGWRGRAEQIRNLQQKLAELQARLFENERSQKESSGRRITYIHVSIKLILRDQELFLLTVLYLILHSMYIFVQIYY